MVFYLVVKEESFFFSSKMSFLVELGFCLLMMFGSFPMLQEKPSRELPGWALVPLLPHPSWPVTKQVQEVSKPFWGCSVLAGACCAPSPPNACLPGARVDLSTRVSSYTHAEAGQRNTRHPPEGFISPRPRAPSVWRWPDCGHRL